MFYRKLFHSIHLFSHCNKSLIIGLIGILWQAQKLSSSSLMVNIMKDKSKAWMSLLLWSIIIIIIFVRLWNSFCQLPKRVLCLKAFDENRFCFLQHFVFWNRTNCLNTHTKNKQSLTIFLIFKNVSLPEYENEIYGERER